MKNKKNIPYFDTIKVLTPIGIHVGFVTGYSCGSNGKISVLDMCKGFSVAHNALGKKLRTNNYRRLVNIQEVGHTRMVLVEKTIDVKKLARNRQYGVNYPYERYPTSYQNETETSERKIHTTYWEKGFP